MPPPPPAEEKKGGLKIKTGEGKSLNSAATQAVPLPTMGTPAAPAASDAKATVLETPDASARPSAPAPAAGKGPGTVETIAAVAACLAMITGAVRIVMDLMQQF